MLHLLHLLLQLLVIGIHLDGAHNVILLAKRHNLLNFGDQLFSVKVYYPRQSVWINHRLEWGVVSKIRDELLLLIQVLHYDALYVL